MAKLLVAGFLFVAACGAPASLRAADLAVAAADLAELAPVDGGAADAGPVDGAAPFDAGADLGRVMPPCEWGGAPGQCLSSAACSALGDHTAESGTCATGLVCCIVTPNVADNPPVPSGWKLMQSAQVTTAMTNWAVAILHDPVTYPMFATTTMQFGTLLVLARVEWHPPDFQNSIVHRGVTLYVPTS